MAVAKASTNDRSVRSTSSTSFRSLSSDTGSSVGCVIAKGTVIDGEMATEENVRLDGVIKGSLSCKKRLVLGKSGKIEGSVNVKEADIGGVIEGDIVTNGLLVLRPNAKVLGNISTKSIQIELGAVYVGECKIG
ncbi:MAG: polymer-forming cytoskeletal protein [Bacteroidota bacterium]